MGHRAALRAIYIDEAVAIVAEVMAADRTPRAEEIVEVCRRNVGRMDRSGAIDAAMGDDVEVARARFRASLRPAIMRAIADLRPS